jgi:hypothetical protein
VQVTSIILKTRHRSILFLAIPLALSAFTHLWNPVGFPSIQPDEGTYLRRAMYVMEYLSPQDPSSRFDHSQVSMSSYDHPYFGQIFLASIFKLIGYPGILDPKPGDVHSIEMLYTVPRVLMGILAVVDTFLIYKIAEVRYNSNRKVAFIASILFAVMPLSWMTRRIVLDSILLPFLLLSILFAVYYYNNANKKNENKNTRNNNSSITSNSNNENDKKKKNNTYLILLSGIFLGLAIFTKIPAFTMIPLVGFLIFYTKKNNTITHTLDKFFSQQYSSSSIIERIKRIRNITNLKALGIWFIPVILIPLIWPAYAISVGQFDSWLKGLSWQATERSNAGLVSSIYDIFEMDPVLVTLAIAGFVFVGCIKRDLFLLLWIIPFIIFLYLIHWTVHFHWIPVLPVFCIAAAVMIVDLSNKASKNKKIQKIFPFTIISAIGIFGFISTTMLTTIDFSSFQVKAMAFATKYMPEDNKDITIISGPIYSWIPKYIFHIDKVFFNYNQKDQSIKTTKALLIVDRFFKDYITDDKGNLRLVGNIAANNVIDNSLETYWSNRGSGSWIQADLGENKTVCGVKIAWFKGYQRSYDFAISVSSDGSAFTNVYSGMSGTKTYTSEKYDFGDTIGRYVRITVNKNAYNDIAAMSEISIYGYPSSMGIKSSTTTTTLCKSLEIGNVVAGINSGYIPANSIFKGYKPAKSQTSYPDRLGTLYNNTNTLAKFEGISQYYDLDKYPYTNIGSGGRFVEIRSNYR